MRTKHSFIFMDFHGKAWIFFLLWQVILEGERSNSRNHTHKAGALPMKFISRPVVRHFFVICSYVGVSFGLVFEQGLIMYSRLVLNLQSSF